MKKGFGWMLGYVVFTFLSFPHPLSLLGGPAGAVLDLGLWLSWLAPLCLVAGLGDRPPRAAALSAFGWTVLAHGAVLHFIYVVTVVYGHAPAPIGVLAPFALATYAALIAAIFGAGWAWLRARALAGPFAGALLWTALDHFRAFFLTGWPWATLGYAQHLNPALMGVPQWTGVYGLSFTVVLGGLALGDAFRALRDGTRPGTPTLAALGVVVLLHVFGFATRIDPGSLHAGEETIRVAAIQGNIDQGVKWNASWVERTLSSYERLSREAAAKGAELIVWPETALPGALEADARMQQRLTALAAETGATLVVGSVGVDFGPRGRVERFYDSAFFIESDGGVREDRYDKAHLVPFGEYVPLRGLLGGLLGAVASGIASGDVTPGTGSRAIDLTLGTGRRPVRVGVPICYELLFPDEVRGFASDGGGVLLGITNDAWYGRTGAPYHFLAITAMRSAETGLYGVRAANTGVSAVIDSGGWVRRQTPIFEEAFLVADVPLRPPAAASSGTFYVRFGNVFAWACWLGLLAVIAVGWRRPAEG